MSGLGIHPSTDFGHGNAENRGADRDEHCDCDDPPRRGDRELSDALKHDSSFPRMQLRSWSSVPDCGRHRRYGRQSKFMDNGVCDVLGLFGDE